jgi:hypothetical protein
MVAYHWILPLSLYLGEEGEEERLDLMMVLGMTCIHWQVTAVLREIYQTEDLHSLRLMFVDFEVGNRGEGPDLLLATN